MLAGAGSKPDANRKAPGNQWFPGAFYAIVAALSDKLLTLVYTLEKVSSSSSPLDCLPAVAPLTESLAAANFSLSRE